VSHEQVKESTPPIEALTTAAAEIASDDPDLAELLAAASAGDLQKVAQLLNRRPALVRAHAAEGQTALHVAAMCDDARLGALLLAAGADPQAKYGTSGHTAMSWALTCNSLSFAGTLVRLGHQPDLFCAAGMGSIEHVQAFFDEAGALAKGASQTGSSRFARDGMRLPCPPLNSIEQISDALYIACRNGQPDVVRYLLARGADLSFRAYLGGTALHWAHFGGSRIAIELLEQAGADREARDDAFQCTPRAFGICVPANWGFPAMVRQRLAADPALANLMDGRTSPLHQAACGGNIEVVKLLLDAGADPLLRDGDGKTARELAARECHALVVDLLAASVPTTTTER
jgi:ankyrin repeat protein